MPEFTLQKLPTVAGWFLLLGLALPAFGSDSKPPFEKTTTPPSPSAVVVAEAHYSAEVTDGVARIDCRFVVDAKTDGSATPDERVAADPSRAATLPIDFGESAVGTLKADNDDTYLRGLGKGRFALVTKGKGRRTVRLQLLAKVAATKQGHSFALNGPPAGITTLDVAIAKPNQVISVSPTLVAEKVKADPKASRAKGHLTSAAKIAVSWKERVAPAKHKPLITVAETSRVHIDQTSVVTHARLKCGIYRQAVSELKFALPKDVRVLDVTLPVKHPGRWSEAMADDRRVITVQFSEPVKGDVEVKLAIKRGIADGTATIPPIATLAAARQTGLIAMTHSPRIETTIDAPEGWTRVTAKDVTAALRDEGAEYYRHAKPESPLSIAVKEAKAHITVHQNVEAQLEMQSANLKSTLRYHITQPGVESLEIQLPQGVKVEDVAGPLVKSHKIDETKSPAMLLVQLKRVAVGEVKFGVTAVRKISTSDELAEVEIPLLRPLEVAESTLEVLMRSRSLKIIDAASGITDLVRVRAPEVDRFEHQYHWTAIPARVTARVIRRLAHRSMHSRAKLRFSTSGIDVSTTLWADWRRLPQKPLRLLVPQSAVKSIEISDSEGRPIPFKVIDENTQEKARKAGAILEVSPAVLRIAAKFFELPLLTVNYRLPGAVSDEKGAAAEWTYRPILPLSEDGKPLRMVARIAIETDSMRHVAIRHLKETVIEGTALTSGDHTAINARRPITFHITPLQPVPQPELLVARALIEVAVGRDSNAVYRCRYRIRPNDGVERIDNLLHKRIRVELPKTVEPLAVYVNGHALALEKDGSKKAPEGWGAYVLDVSQAATRDEPLELCLQFRISLTPAAFDFSFGKVRLHLPRLADDAGTPAVVENLKTAVWVPQRFALVGEPVGLTGESKTALRGFGPRDLSADSHTDACEQWIGFAPPGEITFPQSGHVYRFEGVSQPRDVDLAYADMTFATWALSLPLLLIGLLLARSHWQNKLSLVLLLACGTTLAAVRRGDVIYHGLLAARYGLAGVAVWWMVRGLQRRRVRHIVAHPSHRRTPPCHLPLSGLTAVVIPPPGTFETQPPRATAAKAA